MYLFSVQYWFLISSVAFIHAMVGARIQRLLLLVAGLVAYGSIDLRLFVPLAVIALSTWAGMRCTRFTDDRYTIRFVRAAMVVVAVLPLVVLRFAGAAVDSVERVSTQFLGRADSFDVSLWAPVGVAFMLLIAIEGMYDSEADGDGPGFLDHLLVVSFLPTAFAGPLPRYRRLAQQLGTRRVVSRPHIDRAALWIMFGFLWSVIADNMLPIAESVLVGDRGEGLEIVVAAAAFSIGIVADLAGLSAFAIASALLFGIELRIDNVDRPYLSRSVIEFWDRWNRSVTQWFLRRVTIPLERARSGGDSTMPLLVGFAVTFLWYVDGGGSFVWALLHLGAVIFQASARRRRAPRSGRLLSLGKAAMALGFVTYSWLWFAAGSLPAALRLHRDALSFELTSFAVAGGVTVGGFGLMLVASDLLARAMIPAVGPRGERPPGARPREVDSSVVRGVVVAGVVAITIVCTTPVVHPSIVGLA